MHYRSVRPAALAALAALAVAQPCVPGDNYPNGDLPKMPVEIPLAWGLSNASARSVCATMCQAEPLCSVFVELDVSAVSIMTTAGSTAFTSASIAATPSSSAVGAET